jgi:hypothetical protein
MAEREQWVRSDRRALTDSRCSACMACGATNDETPALPRVGKVRGVSAGSPSSGSASRLPGEVSEGLVGVGHAMHVFALANCGAFAVVGCDQLIRQLYRHRAALLFSGG